MKGKRNMAYSNDYTELLKRLNAGEKIKVRFEWEHYLIKKQDFVTRTHYGIMCEDDWRYFITSKTAGIDHFEPCLSRNKYTANLHKAFSRYKLEYKKS